MFKLGQNLKMPKRCEKQLYDHTRDRVNVWKKPPQERPTIRKVMRAF